MTRRIFLPNGCFDAAAHQSVDDRRRAIEVLEKFRLSSVEQQLACADHCLIARLLLRQLRR